MDTRIGGELAGYRIESVIGRGGMGVVYLAEHLRLKRKVALKVLPPELAEDERFRDRFIHESELAASLDHPNIVDIYDAGEADGLLYLAMRYVRGSDLKSIVRSEGPLEPERAVALLTQVAGALDIAHGRGLVHRDIKSANVLIEPPAGSLGEHAYLTDFGLTKRPESMSGLTKTGQFLGSVEYAAPEQFDGKPLGPWTDVYSLACVAYECLTGQVPFPRDSEAAVMYAHLKEHPPKVTDRRAELAGGLNSVVAAAMAKRPTDRPPTAGALVEALRAAAAGDAPVGRKRPRRRGMLLATAGTLLIAAAVVAFIVTRSPSAKPPGGPAAGEPPAAFNGVVALDQDGHRVGQPIPIAFVHSDTLFEKQIAIGEGFEWVADATANDVHKISLTSNTVVFTVSVSKALGFAFARGSVWMSQGSPITDDRTVTRIDPRTNSLSHPVDVRSTCCGGVAVADGAVWVLAHDSLSRLDPSTARVVMTTDTGGERVVAAEGKLWVLNALSETLFEVNPRTGKVAQRFSLTGSPTAVAIGFGAAWVTDRTGRTVSRIPLNGEGGTDVIPVGKTPNDIGVGDGVVWVANAGDGTVSRIPASGGAATSFHVGGFPTHLAVARGTVWVLVERTLPAAIPG
jgi:hypothetical protein